MSSTTYSAVGNRYDLLLFDADGTLFDYDKAETWALEQALTEKGISCTQGTIRTYREINHEFWKAFEKGEVTITELRTQRFSRLLERLGNASDPLELGERYLAFLGQAGFLIEGTLELLERLHKTHRLALITNGITETQYGRLAASGIGSFFDPVVISGEVGFQKPDPAIFEILFHKAGFRDKSKALIIGDSLSSDMKGGINFGIDTCWFNPASLPGDSGTPVTYQVRSLSEIIEIV